MIGDYPEYESKMQRKVYTYKQSRKKFFYQIASRIEYFKGMSIPMYHDLYYTHLRPQSLDEGEYLIKKGEDTSYLYIIELGQIEVVKTIEGNEFVVEKLGRGSILNYTSIFVEDD